METRQIFQKKAETAYTKSFWQMINQLQGKFAKKNPKIIKDGIPISNNEFTQFFENKILKLTSASPNVNKKACENQRMAPFTFLELEKSLRFYKTKVSSGLDEIPMRLIKFYAMKRPRVILEILNSVLLNGFPDCWRIARLTPVPKKGDLTNLNNYCSVSNLPSLSKLFERCILHRLMALPNYQELVSSHQHGFRPYHSPTMCLLQLKDTICDKHLKEKGSGILLGSLCRIRYAAPRHISPLIYYGANFSSYSGRGAWSIYSMSMRYT